MRRPRTLVGAVALTASLAACAPQLSPTQMVGPESSNVAVAEFLHAARVLANHYNLDFTYASTPIPDVRGPMAFGISPKQSIPYNMNLQPRSEFTYDRQSARNYFIRAGHHASQIICRNYLSGLRDRNEYFEFLKQEMKIATNLTGVLLTLTSVPEKTKDIFTQVVAGANLAADQYQTFRFLAPEIETVLPLVEAAQVAMRDYYTIGKGKPYTFAGALNAVSKIEYQCSRSGIRSILTKTLVQAKPQYTVVDGVLYAHEAKDQSPVTTKTEPAPGAGK